MSAEALPISPEQFAVALETLPVSNLYAKTFELRNSIAHLERSNAELELFMAESGRDEDCAQAVEENKQVIDRMRQRVELIKAEVEKRGARWHEADATEDSRVAVDGVTDEQLTEDEPQTREHQVSIREGRSEEDRSARPGGRLTDEQLRHQVLSQLNGEEDDEEDGVHL